GALSAHLQRRAARPGRPRGARFPPSALATLLPSGIDRGVRFGDLTLTLVNGGSFRLDGGAMHGVVPKSIWSKLTSCDEQNRCQYATNCLLVDGPGFRVLIETGNGDKFPEKERQIYGIDHDHSVVKELAARGVDAASVTHVVMTHLHFDHSG